MLNLNFKYIRAQNFLCFGKDGIEISLTDLENIVLIKGVNQDTKGKGSLDKESSNGVGKSSIPEILVFGLYGKTIKRPKKIAVKDVLNAKNPKKMIVEVRWDNYRVLRSRKPDELKLWHSEEGIWDETTEITQGGMPATQKKIEEIIGLTYEAFINIVVFSDDNSVAFLECDKAGKREIIENLLGLEKYRNYLETTKDLLKEKKELHKSKLLLKSALTNNNNNIKNNLKSYFSSIENWKKDLLSKKQQELAAIERIKKIVPPDLNKESERYNKAQVRIAELNTLIPPNIELVKKYQTQISMIKAKRLEITPQTNDLQQKIMEEGVKITQSNSDIRKHNDEINKMKRLEPGAKCTGCYQIINPENYPEHIKEHEEKIESLKLEITQATEKQNEFKTKKEELDLKIKKLDSMETESNNKITEIQTTDRKYNQELTSLLMVKEPEKNSEQIKNESQIEFHNKKINDIETQYKGATPYDDLIKNAEQDLAKSDIDLLEIDKEIKTIEDIFPYYQFWLDAFGDSGIRKFAVDQVIPTLNESLDFWLNILIENNLSIKFDNELDYLIEKHPYDGSSFIYEVLSNGQRRRINLSVSQGFANVMMLTNGVVPNVVFLDEVTTNIDPQGVHGIYTMIYELSKTKKVFVTTHDKDLLNYLNGCQTINLVMKNGISQVRED